MDFQKLFQSLLRNHIKMGYLRDRNIQEILGNLPVERLFDENQLKRFILADSPVLFYYRDEKNLRTVSAPHMISMMTSMLELDPSDNVLILGSKGGLIEATIAKAVNDTKIVEEHNEVASITEESFIKLGVKNLWVERKNPMYGLSEYAPFSKILITGAIPFIPHALIDQLSINGILVVPLMIYHPNNQKIFQIIKQADNLEIINFGGVIFSPLYFNELPQIDLKNDITMQKIINSAQDEKKQLILEEKDFFEEFRELPIVEFHNLIFTRSQKIFHSIPFNQKKNQEFIQSNDDQIQYIESYLQISLFNLGSLPCEGSLEIYIPSINQKQIIKNIILTPQILKKVKFNFKVPLQESSFPIHFICISVKRYRLAHGRAIIHIIKNETLSEWEFSIEFLQ